MNFTGKCDDILSVEKIEIICENFVYPTTLGLEWEGVWEEDNLND